MKTATRPQYHRLRRILEMIREGTCAGSLPNCRHFIRELEVSRRTLMRDLDFLRDDHHAPIAYDSPLAPRAKAPRKLLQGYCKALYQLLHSYSTALPKLFQSSSKALPRLSPSRLGAT